MGDEIFVQIAAYRDPQLVATLDSLFAQAHCPDRLRVCVCWQHSRSERLPPRWRSARQVEIIDVDHRTSRGANWARRQVQRRWRGEAYSLIIDSHLRFARHWDRTLVRLFNALKMKTPRPLLTCYPPDFHPATFPTGASRTPLKTYKERYINGLLVHFAGFPLPFWRWLTEPIAAEFLALGLLFTEGRFNVDVRIDPSIYFFGDEITTGLRAYCHGYDFFHPHRVVAWHAYDRTTRRCHWQDHDDWSRRDERSLRHVRRVLHGGENHRFPLGTVRSISDYESFIGARLTLPSTVQA
jgi:hypothetical protein